MTLMKWRPVSDLMGMHEKINRLFDDLVAGQREAGQSGVDWVPSTDIYETKDQYVFRFELPGMSRDEIQIDLKNQVLSVTGERKGLKDVQEEQCHRMESFSGRFFRSFTLPRNIDVEKVGASLRDGILEIRVPKPEEHKARPIPIKID